MSSDYPFDSINFKFAINCILTCVIENLAHMNDFELDGWHKNVSNMKFMYEKYAFFDKKLLDYMKNVLIFILDEQNIRISEKLKKK